MLQLVNNTLLQATRAAVVDPNGNQIWVVVVKATYIISVDGSLQADPQPEEVCLCPIYSGKPGDSSLLRESEIVFDHPGTDISLLGTAYSPRQQSTTVLDATVSIGQITKTIRVFGDRVWQNGLGGPQISEPQTFTSIPISYERAFGGGSQSTGGEIRRACRLWSPIGIGFNAVQPKNGAPLPNIEDPDHLIQDWNDCPSPAGFGPIPIFWSPRKELSGTFDDDWLRNRMPLWPSDYDCRSSQSAHPDLVSQEPLIGGERVTLLNLTPKSILEFNLPRPYIIISTITLDGKLRQKVQLDRVIIEPDRNKLVMVWRSSLNCGSGVRRVVSTTVSLKPRIPLSKSQSGGEEALLGIAR